MPSSKRTPGALPQSLAIEFPMERLCDYRGRWVAFSPDGSRLIAHAITLPDLEAKVRAEGENPEEVLLERIPNGNAVESGAELS